MGRERNSLAPNERRTMQLQMAQLPSSRRQRAIVAHAQTTRRPIEAGLAIIRFAAFNSLGFQKRNGLTACPICNGTKETHMATGTVKWFNSTKGFGFIQPDNGGQDVFVHISAVERAGLSTLNDGQKINYEIEQDRRTGKSSAGSLSKAG
jgi:CspA family cold shock protein